jgi:hypothetical protein
VQWSVEEFAEQWVRRRRNDEGIAGNVGVEGIPPTAFATIRLFSRVIVAVGALLEGGCAVVALDLDARGWRGNDEKELRRDYSDEIEDLHLAKGES